MQLKRALLTCLFLHLIFSASAQTWEVGGFAGGSGYIGDLNPVKPYKITGFAYGGQVKRNFDGYWSLKLNVMHGRIRAADSLSENAYYKLRNLSFFSPVTEVSVQVEFNFFNYIPSISRKRFSPYLFTGLGGVIFNPKTVYNGTVYELKLYGTEGQDISDSYKTYALTIPYGAGVKYNITGKLSLIAELGYRTAMTDYLDDVSTVYPDRTTLYNSVAAALSDRSGEKTEVYLGVAGTQRGDFRKKDTYMFTGLSLTYTFISRKCPVVQ